MVIFELIRNGNRSFELIIWMLWTDQPSSLPIHNSCPQYWRIYCPFSRSNVIKWLAIHIYALTHLPRQADMSARDSCTMYNRSITATKCCSL